MYRKAGSVATTKKWPIDTTATEERSFDEGASAPSFPATKLVARARFAILMLAMARLKLFDRWMPARRSALAGGHGGGADGGACELLTVVASSASSASSALALISFERVSASVSSPPCEPLASAGSPPFARSAAPFART